jgi:hypothetical protein
VTRPRQDYQVWWKEHVPAYSTWEPYERNRARFEANRAHAETMGAVRQGPSRWAGLLVCGTWHGRRQVRYGGPKTLHSDPCTRLATDSGADDGQYLPGAPIDTFVSHWVLKALAPAALTRSLAAAARLEDERQALDQLWQQRLERAAYESERAARHDRLVEPEHRLVARQLATDWDDTLSAQRQLHEDDERFVHVQPRLVSRAEREAIAR